MSADDPRSTSLRWKSWNDFVFSVIVSSISGQDDIRAIARTCRLGLLKHVARLDREVPGSSVLAINCNLRDGRHPCASLSFTWFHQVRDDTGLLCSCALDRTEWMRAVPTAASLRVPDRLDTSLHLLIRIVGKSTNRVHVLFSSFQRTVPNNGELDHKMH